MLLPKDCFKKHNRTKFLSGSRPRLSVLSRTKTGCLLLYKTMFWNKKCRVHFFVPVLSDVPWGHLLAHSKCYNLKAHNCITRAMLVGIRGKVGEAVGLKQKWTSSQKDHNKVALCCIARFKWWRWHLPILMAHRRTWGEGGGEGGLNNGITWVNYIVSLICEYKSFIIIMLYIPHARSPLHLTASKSPLNLGGMFRLNDRLSYCR